MVKVAVVTGASRGLGASIAQVLAVRGYRVAIAGRDGDALAAVANQIDGEVVPHVGDLTVASDRARLIEQAHHRWGHIDVLVNNAALAPVSSVARMSSNDLESVVSTNLTAPIQLIQAVLPSMFARESGRILNISSTFGLAGSPYLAPYGATKAALRSLGWSLARELRDSGVHVTTAIPGPLRGGTMLDRLSDAVDGGMPWMPSVTTARAAERIVRAMEHRRLEVVIAPGGRLGASSRRASQAAVRLLGVTGALERHAEAGTVETSSTQTNSGAL